MAFSNKTKQITNYFYLKQNSKNNINFFFLQIVKDCESNL